MELSGILAVSVVEIAVGVVVGLVVGVVALWLSQKASGKSQVQQAREKCERIEAESKEKAESIVRTAQVESRAQTIQRREEFDKETSRVRDELHERDRLLNKREDTVERKSEAVIGKERNLESREAKLGAKELDLTSKGKQLTNTLNEQRAQLLRIANVSEDEAKHMLLDKLDGEVRQEASQVIERVVAAAQEEASSRAREVTLHAIQRYAAAHSCDSTVSTVDIPSDDMKGRVIGREGRNIRAFEKATGVDVIIDDTPGLVVVSAFDPVRREIARLSLDKLIQDGRIHPARIEEVVVEMQKEMDEKLLELGKKATLETNLNGLNSKLLPYLGRLHFRTSFGQNVLRHSIEVAFLSQTMAEELGLDGNLARRCGLLHDIGKAADHEIEGGHPAIGADIIRRLNEKPEVVNAVAGHHGDVPPTSPYTVLVTAADAMSASRPGARRETLERYIKRLEDLEGIATSFDGIKQAYAIQAGREIRVLVDPEQVDDGSAWKTARDIAKKIEAEMSYPGEVKVTLLREVRCIEYAR